MELQTIKVLMVGRVVRDGGLAELMSAADGLPPLSACWEEQEKSFSVCLQDLYITAPTFTVTWLHAAAVPSCEK